MGEALHHRGPDDGGVWVDAAAGIALAHRRLAIVDLSPAGHQPMVSADGNWVLVYNGEIFNQEQLRPELEARGISHVLVGQRSFHQREEVEAVRTALAAVEWPGDELSVFAPVIGRKCKCRARNISTTEPTSKNASHHRPSSRNTDPHMRPYFASASWFLTYRLTNLVCLVLIGSAMLQAIARSEETRNQEQPYRPEPGKFPSLEKGHQYRGVLAFVDHANRRGSLRVETPGEFFRNGPHPFAMLPSHSDSGAARSPSLQRRPGQFVGEEAWYERTGTTNSTSPVWGIHGKRSGSIVVDFPVVPSPSPPLAGG